jgi:hypothetical protein
MVLALAGCDAEDSAPQNTVTTPQNHKATLRHLGNTEKLLTINTFGHTANYVVQESDDIPLLANKVSVDAIREIAAMVSVTGYRSYRDVTNTIIGLNDIAAVEELRQVKVGDRDYYYCVYENQNNGKLYVFFNDYFFEEADVIYSEKRLTFDDFLSLKEGVSTKDDVAEIDPIANLDITQSFGEFHSFAYENNTLHMTAEGYVEIRYTKGNVVKKIIKKESGLIQSINKNDL